MQSRHGFHLVAVGKQANAASELTGLLPTKKEHTGRPKLEYFMTDTKTHARDIGISGSWNISSLDDISKSIYVVVLSLKYFSNEVGRTLVSR